MKQSRKKHELGTAALYCRLSRDDKADLSDVVHIFFRSGLFSHGVLLSQMQNKIIVLPYDLGTKCPKVFLKGGSAAPAPVGLS